MWNIVVSRKQRLICLPVVWQTIKLASVLITGALLIPGGGTQVQGVAQGDLTVQAMVNGKGEIAASS